ncbi:ABC transporter ATP-binding protein [Tessaracoccus palaemonis]|uniref:ABC transporter ATP-binding protein n=1 Tax=Tessaracoccus palaemonis TaxID=2829499 RepID=A0ABX8SP12_9ACTN|nr:ABC transporter ATP-binding protein [Tessaracoccus palaemonis]QXT64157.1 ABC transporter ATP-binding protein [Tessaracoccus palaemonis]
MTTTHPIDTGSRLSATGITVGYGDLPVLEGVSVDVLDGQFTVIVGPNACGKSTLLRSLARVLPVSAGQVTLDGRPVTSYPPKEVARRLALLPQSPTAPEGIRVVDLVSRGRYPHQGLLRQWSEADEAAVARAMDAAGVADLAERGVEELSGGQRQRVWIALTLAQETPLLLLDEPTTYLDISHQLEVLDLAEDLQRQGRTVVVVLHELSLAFRYATHLVVMDAGRIVAQGAPEEIVTPGLIEDVFGVACRVVPDPETGTPLVVPRRREARS